MCVVKADRTAVAALVIPFISVHRELISFDLAATANKGQQRSQT